MLSFSESHWTTGCSNAWWTLLLELCLGILHPPFIDIDGRQCTCTWGKNRGARKRRKMLGRTYTLNKPLRISTSENLLLGHLASKSKSSGVNSNCPIPLLEFQLFSLPCIVLLLFLFWFITVNFCVCDSFGGCCCFSSKRPLTEVTAAGQGFEKHATSAKSIPEALGCNLPLVPVNIQYSYISVHKLWFLLQ